MLRAVEAVQSQGSATLQTAVDVLGLPTDVALAHVVEHPQEAPNIPAAARAGTEAVMGLVDTYMSERLLDTSSATLRGFVGWVNDQNADTTPGTPTAPAMRGRRTWWS